jgi:hypothetical protein
MPNIPAVFSWMFLRLCVACRVIRRRAFQKEKKRYRKEKEKSFFCLYRKDYRHLMAQTESKNKRLGTHTLPSCAPVRKNTKAPPSFCNYKNERFSFFFCDYFSYKFQEHLLKERRTIFLGFLFL